jgi:hypothetical protein
MRKLTILLLIILSAFKGYTQEDSINQRIFLIGDAGTMPGPTHPIIDWLKKNADWNDEKNTVIFLGDNVYPLGLPMEGEPSYALSKRILDDQISLVKGKKARAYFVPGNHDWRNGKLGGWEQVINEEDYINGLEQKNIQAWPINGCPGPIQVELSDKVVVAFVDSQWFLYLHDKPGPSSNCDAKTVDEFQTELSEIAATHPNQLVIIAMHHPIYSYGSHGGDYTWKEHIFPFTAVNPKLYIPLPIIGSIYPIARGVFGSVQDIPHPLYKTFANTVEDVVKKQPYTIVVAGHEHGLQYNVKDSIPYIVSGAGSELSRIKPGRYSKFADVHYGFSLIEVWKSGKVDVKFYNLNSADLNAPTYTAQLKTLAPVTKSVAAIDTTRIILDSVKIVAANPELKGNGFQKFLMGKNYRKEWTEPVRVSVLDLSKEMGGLKPLKQGGGKQTKSLRVEDSTKKEWSLRSIIKYPEAAIPPDLRQTFVRSLVEDGISASYPYGALSMGVLSKAAGVPYLRDRLVYLPDDPRLDRFRAAFKNTMALMEEREPMGSKKTDNTDELVLKLAKDNDNHVDQKAVLKARLLDNFVMDLDRHEGQWEWATRDTGRGKIFYPIPKDRDQVFFVNQGLLPYFIKSSWLVPDLQGFRAKAYNIKTFNRSARNFDRTFLTELTEQDWRNAVDTFLSTMTDSVIETALRQQPVEVQRYSVPKIINTLKEKRKYFEHDMLQYYKFLSKKVTIVGTNKKEQFTITKNDDGSVRVVVNKLTKEGVSSKIYDRLFNPKITKEIRLFGLNDDDRFIVEGGKSPIKIRMIGGSGKDEFINNGSGGKALVYDVKFEENKLSGNTAGFRNKISNDPQVNRYDRLNFKYNQFIPLLGFEYNKDDGVFIGLRFEYTTQGFRKEPYGMRQFFEAKKALKTSSYHFTYNADFIKAIGNTDILIRSDFKAPVNVTNFFGIGNNSVKDESKDISYYRSKYNIIDATVYFRRQPQSWLRLNFGPTYQYFYVDSLKNVGHYVNTITDDGGAHPGLYQPKNYLGFDARLDIDSRNNPVLPSRGTVLNAGIRPMFGIGKASNNLTQANFDIKIFMSLARTKGLVFATRIGWGASYGHFEFPQAQYLGATDNLRGFRKQRFAGRSMLFNNSELRIRILNFNTYLFPGSIGLIIFNDVGRVWAEGESSNTWHDGYGGGFWISPINRFIGTLYLAHSKEESVYPRITLGFQF